MGSEFQKKKWRDSFLGKQMDDEKEEPSVSYRFYPGKFIDFLTLSDKEKADKATKFLIALIKGDSSICSDTREMIFEAMAFRSKKSAAGKAAMDSRYGSKDPNSFLKPKRPPNVSPDGEVIEQKKPSKMIIPTQEEVNNFAAESFLNTNEAKKFFCYYDSNGWRVGKNPMKNWKSAFKGWCARATETPSRAQPKTFAQIDEEERQESYRKAQERINNYGK